MSPDLQRKNRAYLMNKKGFLLFLQWLRRVDSLVGYYLLASCFFLWPVFDKMLEERKAWHGTYTISTYTDTSTRAHYYANWSYNYRMCHKKSTIYPCNFGYAISRHPVGIGKRDLEGARSLVLLSRIYWITCTTTKAMLCILLRGLVHCYLIWG